LLGIRVADRACGRRATPGTWVAWLGSLAERETGTLAAGRVHVDRWAATRLDTGAAHPGVRRGLSALSSFTDSARSGSSSLATPIA
jgi:hypothetical protein